MLCLGAAAWRSSGPGWALACWRAQRLSVEFWGPRKNGPCPSSARAAVREGWPHTGLSPHPLGHVLMRSGLVGCFLLPTPQPVYLRGTSLPPEGRSGSPPPTQPGNH